MPVRTAPSSRLTSRPTSRPTSSPTSRSASVASPAPATDPALDEALEHIGSLAERLWAVRRLHAPLRSRLGVGRVRCSGCGQAHPCPTLRATEPPQA